MSAVMKDPPAPYTDAGPTMLAAQPVTEPKKQPRVAENDWTLVYAHLEARLQAMRSWRWSWWVHWAQLAEYILPRRYHWLVVANRMTRGMPINTAIVDSTATQAMQTCAAGLWTGLTSPSRPWFNLGIGLPWIELDADGKAWLEDTQERIYTVLAGSNFYTTMAQAFQDVSTFGTAPVIIYEDHEDGIRCFSPCAGEYYLDCGARLSVDVLYREFTLNVSQIIDMFKVENCPPDVTKLWQAGGASLQVEFVIAHAIEPNFEIASRGGSNKPAVRVVPGAFSYREVYWVRGNRAPNPLSVKGFNEKPFIVARWSTVSNDPYGRGPGMDALPDTKQLQLETRRKAEFIEKGVRPPMGANVELKNEPSSILPGNITYTNTTDGKKGFWPLFEPAPQWLAGITADIKDVQERIKKAFFVDIFMAISQMEGVQPRNELELTKRDLERLQVLGPFIELFETECASPAIQRILAIMERRRMLKPKPQSLANIPLKINYVSIMKLAQQSAESVAIKDVLSTAGALSSAAKAAGVQDPLRTIDLDKALQHYGELNNFPMELFYPADVVAQHDQARAIAAQRQQVAAATPATVMAAKTLSETQLPGGNTALGAILGGQGGQ